MEDAGLVQLVDAEQHLGSEGLEHLQLQGVDRLLDDLVDLRDQAYSPDADKTTAIRVYTSFERIKLNTDCRGFILFMEQMDVLDCQAREMVIDRAIALEGEEVDLDRLKWVVMMVLYNMPDREGEFGDEGGVEPAGEEATQRDVGFETIMDSGTKEGFEVGGRSGGRFACGVGLPIWDGRLKDEIIGFDGEGVCWFEEFDVNAVVR